LRSRLAAIRKPLMKKNTSTATPPANLNCVSRVTMSPPALPVIAQAWP